MSTNKTAAWSLETELCNIAGISNLREALCSLGLLVTENSSFKLESVDKDWYRGGAETYIYRFYVHEQHHPSSNVLIKACVAFSPGRPVEKILNEWIGRRKLLEAYNVQTPKLYGVGQGVLIEEFIPFTLDELLKTDKMPLRDTLGELINYATALLKNYFTPVGPFSDLRSHGEDVVVIDFGEDLGPPHVRSTPPFEIYQMLFRYLQSLGIDENAYDFEQIRSLFASQGVSLVKTKK